MFKFHSVLLLAVVAASTVGGAQAQDVFDSDGDGKHDNEDNCTLHANFDPADGRAQRDTDGDYMGNRCDPDFNNDNAINFTDLDRMRASLFSTTDPDTDLDGDGVTNFADLRILSDMFFGRPGPTATDPATPPCNCYFTGDCNDGDPTTNLFCDWGVLTAENNCVWRNVKPDGVWGAGCSIESNLDTGEWVPGICDGVCVERSRGSTVGLEDSALVAETLALWGEAMMAPSAAGGGPLDAELARTATAMPFAAETVPMILGRHAADLLAMAAGEPFHNYFCHWEGHPEDISPPVVDLAGDNCRIRAGELALAALTAEIRTPGSAAAIMNEIPRHCADWQQMFATQCAAGPRALDCAIQFVEAQAYFLRTPPTQPTAVPDALGKLIGAAQR